MSDEGSVPGSPEPETWGAFLPYALANGVTIETLYNVEFGPGRIGSCQYLRREVDGEVLTYPLPDGLTPARRLGFGRLIPLCKRLKLKTPPDWPISF